MARLGYQGFETNYKTLESRAEQAQESRRQLKARHVWLIAAHIGAKLLDNADVSSEIKGLRCIAGVSAAMGAKYMIVSGRRLPHLQAKLDENAAHNKMEALNKEDRSAKRRVCG